MRTISIYWLWLMLVLLAGCAYSIPAPNEPATTDKVLLTWQGYTALGDGDESRCKSLQITASGEVQIGDCATYEQPQPLPEHLAAEWADWQTRVGTFTLDQGEDQLAVQGQGSGLDDAWQRALLQWTRLTYGQLASGRVSATGPTSLSWFLATDPAQPDLCQHLTVLAYGYAYAQLVPCAGGGTPTQQQMGWLTSEELDQFDGWLYAAQPLYAEDNYLAGEGEQILDDAEIADVAAWAAAVYARLQRD